MKSLWRFRNYRLVDCDPATGAVRDWQFTDSSPQEAFTIIRRHCGERPVELFADERSVARLRLVGAGYWEIFPS